MDDLTTIGGVRNLLGAFWTRMVSADSFVSGLAEETSAVFNQLYQDLTEVINSVGIQTIAGYHTELVVPVVISDSGVGAVYGSPLFGDGGIYGPQISGGPWTPGQILYHGTDAERNGSLYSRFANPITGCGTILTDSPANPSVILVRDVDFTIPEEGDGIYFKASLFDDPRITPRTNYDGSRDIVLWMFQVRTDDDSLNLHHGYPFDTGELSGEELRATIARLYAICSLGPTPLTVESFMSVAAGQPITGAEEVVESISTFGESQVVVTDREVYVLPPGTSVARGVIVGAVLPAGKALTSVVSLLDFRTFPEWWRDRPALVFPGNMIHPSFGLSHLCFPNADVVMTLTQGAEIAYSWLLDPGVGPDAYRAEVLARQETSQTFAGNEVWKWILGGSPDNTLYQDPLDKYYTDPDGNMYSTLGLPEEANLNALEVLIEVLGGREISMITVDASGIADLASFATTCAYLEDVAPLGAVIIVVIDATQSDTIDGSEIGDEASLSGSLGINSEHVAIGAVDEQIFLTSHERVP